MILKNSAISAATGILKELYITNPAEVDLDDLAYLRGGVVRDAVMNNCEGRLIRSGPNGIITINSKIREPGKRRFAIAHELGHFELHERANQFSNFVDQNFLEWYKISAIEREANIFAAELLMPDKRFKGACEKQEPIFNNICAVAEFFKTTLTSTAIRYVDLGPYPSMLIVSEAGKIKWFVQSDDFPYRFIKIGRVVEKGSIAFDLFAGKKVNKSHEMVMGSIWLSDDWSLPEDLILYESSIILPSYNTVLSFIWVYEE